MSYSGSHVQIQRASTLDYDNQQINISQTRTEYVFIGSFYIDRIIV